MGMSDPIADMLTRIRNAQAVEKTSVVMSPSKLKVAVAKTLRDEGYINEFTVIEQDDKPMLTVGLEYYAGHSAIERLECVLKSGLRVYRDHNEIPQVTNDLGVVIILTPQDLMTDRRVRATSVGGEVICCVA